MKHWCPVHGGRNLKPGFRGIGVECREYANRSHEWTRPKPWVPTGGGLPRFYCNWVYKGDIAFPNWVYKGDIAFPDTYHDTDSVGVLASELQSALAKAERERIANAPDTPSLAAAYFRRTT